MGHNFKKGDVVECIDDNYPARVVKGKLYTISDGSNPRGVRIKGGSHYLCRASCFRLVESPFTFTVPTRTRDITLTCEDNVAVITCGCFTGTFAEARQAVNVKNRPDYSAALKYLQVIAIEEGLDLKPLPRKPKIGEVWTVGKGEFIVSSCPTHSGMFRYVNLKTGFTSPRISLNEVPPHMKFLRAKVTP